MIGAGFGHLVDGVVVFSLLFLFSLPIVISSCQNNGFRLFKVGTSPGALGEYLSIYVLDRSHGYWGPLPTVPCLVDTNRARVSEACAVLSEWRAD
jgi:hypothetical protein